MAYRFINPQPVYSDGNGDPLNGGKLYFYSIGTSTLKDTYTTSALSVANTNPIVLDSSGRPTDEIWLSGDYRMKLTDSTGATTYFDVDPYREPANATGVQNSSYTWGGTAGGSANTLTITPTPAISAYAAGQEFEFIVGTTNTGAATLNVNSVGAVAITKHGTTALVAGDLVAGKVVTVKHDGTQFQLLNPPTAGRLTAVRTYTANDTWTKPVGLDYIIVEGVGPGGGGGGADVDAGPGSGCGGGGGAGGYARKKIAAASLGATETVTIGGAGAGGTGNNAGSNGAAATTFGAHITCNVGTGGSSMAAGNTVNRAAGGAGGTATGGDINITGQTGGDALRNGNTWQESGAGGTPAFYGIGGSMLRGEATVAGRAGTGYGAGGGGAIADDSGTDQAGGTGTAGLIVVYEYSI